MPMAVNSSTRDLAWDSLLSADLNHRYFAGLADRSRKFDRWGKFAVAGFSSTSALASWAIWNESGVTWVWPVLSGLAAVVALALPVFDPAKSMKAASGLAGAWFSVFKDYELLWTQIDDIEEAKAHSALKELGDEEKRLAELESGLSEKRALAQKCESEVRRYYDALIARSGG